MIRNRLKKAARRVAIRVLNMEFDTEERDPAARRRGDPSKFDPGKIPKVVDGDGDTPGPNHREDIGRPWVSAQLSGGVAPVFIDIRPSREVAGGALPGAILLPGSLCLERTELLPADKGIRLTIYDQTGELGSAEVAAQLRDAGWPLARRLRGGYAEWIEHDESVTVPAAADGGRLRPGDPARVADGREGHIMRSWAREGTTWVEVSFEDGSSSGEIDENILLS